jgi:hypothetical protein
MRVKLLHDCQLLTPIAKTGEWRDVDVEVADYLVGHGYARSHSGLHDRTVRKFEKPIHPVKKPAKSLADFLHAVARRDTYYIERWYNSTFRVSERPDAERKAAMAESGGTIGGYTVPPRFSRRIMALVNERAVFRRAGAQVLPMGSQEPLQEYCDGVDRDQPVFLGSVGESRFPCFRRTRRQRGRGSGNTSP